MDPWYCSMTNSLYRLRKYKTQTGYMSPYYLSKAYITNNIDYVNTTKSVVGSLYVFIFFIISLGVGQIHYMHTLYFFQIFSLQIGLCNQPWQPRWLHYFRFSYKLVELLTLTESFLFLFFLQFNYQCQFYLPQTKIFVIKNL